MLDFKLVTGKKKSNVAIVLLLNRETSLNKIKWLVDYDGKTVSEYSTHINIENTKKKIKIEFYASHKYPSENSLEFFYMKKKHSDVLIKVIQGEITTTLTKSIKKQLENG